MTLLFLIVYFAAMPVMIKEFSRNEAVDIDTDEHAGELTDYGLGPVLMMICWFPVLCFIAAAALFNFFAGIREAE